MTDDRRSGDVPAENSVCAERSAAPSQADVISKILAAAFAPSFAQQLEAMIAEMGEEVRRQERERIVDLLREQSNSIARGGHEDSVTGAVWLDRAARTIEGKSW